jgi:hypothetical protein
MQIVDKCTFCAENIDMGLEPECVKTCPADALIFGDLDDPESEISELIVQWDAIPLHEEYETKPCVYYTAHAARLRGTVTNKRTGLPIRGIPVVVRYVHGTESLVSCTDSSGVFFFWDLRMRKCYAVRIEAEGCALYTCEISLDDEYTDIGTLALEIEGADTRGDA